MKESHRESKLQGQLPKISIMGAPFNTGNLGVSALGYAIVAGIMRRIPNIDITVFDYGSGVRREIVVVDGQSCEFTAVRCVISRKIHSPYDLRNIRLSGLIGLNNNPVIREIRNSNCVLDITGGDSFTDLYGPTRFRSAILRKKIVLNEGVPLILLPQTYGPYRSTAARNAARSVIGRASAVWTRDEHSLGVISELFGADGLPGHCKRGVDVAFLLSAIPPAHDKAAVLQERLSSDETQKIGLNVSGLLYGMDAGKSEFGLRDDYRRTILSIVRWVIQNTGARVFLVPHVSSDVPACKHVLDEAMTYANGRVEFIGDGLDQNELKWVIGQMDWFCGARMHASIAALSSFVPTLVLAYSDKAKGVFAECGQEQSVLDLRTMATAEVVEALGVAWENRKEVASQLQRDLPLVLRKVSSQMDEIAAYCLGAVQ